MTTKFTLMNRPYIYGYEAEREDGITVEVVRCYQGEWTIFLTREGSVVARSIAEYRQCRDGYVSKDAAMRIARELCD